MSSQLIAQKNKWIGIDVGQIKLSQLQRLEKAHDILGIEFDPHKYVSLSRKDLRSVLHEFAQKIVHQKKQSKRAGVVF